MLDNKYLSDFKRWLNINKPELKHSTVHLYLLCAISKSGYEQVRPTVQMYVDMFHEYRGRQIVKSRPRKSFPNIVQDFKDTLAPVDWNVCSEVVALGDDNLKKMLIELYDISEFQLTLLDLQGNLLMYEVIDIPSIEQMNGPYDARIHEVYKSDLSSESKIKIVELIVKKKLKEPTRDLFTLDHLSLDERIFNSLFYYLENK